MANLKKYEPTFCLQTKNLAIALQDSLANNDFQECLRLAHTLKGSAALMGCPGLADFAQKAEKSIKNKQDIDKLKLSCQEIKSLAGDFSNLKKYPN